MTNEKIFVVGNGRGREMNMLARGEQIAAAQQIYDAADAESGYVAPADMVRLFPGQPTMHTDTQCAVALAAIGCEHIAEEIEA